MRSKILQEILDETPKDVKIFVRMYADVVLRINQILKEKGMSQKDLAEQLEKKPSEISKWLNGEHNFTLRSLAKIQAVLDEEILYVPKQPKYMHDIQGSTSMTVYRSNKRTEEKSFNTFSIKQTKRLANVS